MPSQIFQWHLPVCKRTKYFPQGRTVLLCTRRVVDVDDDADDDDDDDDDAISYFCFQGNDNWKTAVGTPNRGNIGDAPLEVVLGEIRVNIDPSVLRVFANDVSTAFRFCNLISSSLLVYFGIAQVNASLLELI